MSDRRTPENMRLRQAIPATGLDRLLGVRRWRAVPMTPNNSMPELALAVNALKERSHVQCRESGNIRDSFVSVQDLLDLGIIDTRGVSLLRQHINDPSAHTTTRTATIRFENGDTERVTLDFSPVEES